MDVQLYNAVSVIIPDEFSAADSDQSKGYFGGTKFDYTFLNQEKSAAAGIVQTGAALTNETVEAKLGAYQQYYSRMVPGFAMGEMRKSSKQGREFGLMTYKSNAPTTDLFNMLAVTSLEDREVVFLFSCDMRDARKYMYQFLGILESVSFLNEIR